MRACLILSPALVPLLMVACDTTTNTTDTDGGAPTVLNTPEAGGASDGAVASVCTPKTGPGTVHHSGSLESDSETWTADASPHVIDFTMTIQQAQTLTLEPCAVVRLTKGTGLYVRGKLLSEGQADRPISIEAADAEPWSVIEANDTSELRLVYTSVAGGGFANGNALDTVGMLDIRGKQEESTQGRLHADHLTVRGSASLGVLLREGGGFSAASRDVVITGSASYPMSSWARALGTIPTGTYTGNKTDSIQIEGAGTRDAILEDIVLANRGVPYRVKNSSLNVGANTGTTKTLLTIESGVELRFAKDSRLLLNAPTSDGVATGALIAAGTIDKPIVFTSDEAAPTPGAWAGILIEGDPDPRNKIDHARVAFAGGTSGISSFDCPSPANTTFSNEGAIVLFGKKPGSAFVTNTTFESSAGDAIIRGWTGDPVDFLPTNVFTGIARCNQTFPKPSVGVCPSPAPCPKS